MVRDTDFLSQNLICVVTKVSDETAASYFRADMETAAPFKTLVTTYQTACYQNPVEKNSNVSSATENANLILCNTKSLFESHSCKIQFINMLTECTYSPLHHTFPTRSHVSKLFIQHKNCTKIQVVWYITYCYFPTCDQRTNSP